MNVRIVTASKEQYSFVRPAQAAVWPRVTKERIASKASQIIKPHAGRETRTVQATPAGALA